MPVSDCHIPVRNAHADSNTYTYGHGDADCHTYFNAYSDAHGNAFTHSYSYSNA